MSSPLAKYVTVKELLHKLADIPRNTAFNDMYIVTKCLIEFPCHPSATEPFVMQTHKTLQWAADSWNNFDISSTSIAGGEGYGQKVGTVSELVKVLLEHVDFTGSVTFEKHLLDVKTPIRMAPVFVTNNVEWRNTTLAESQWKKLRATKAILELFNINHTDTNQDAVDNDYLRAIQATIAQTGIITPFYLLRTVAGNWKLFSSKEAARAALSERYKSWSHHTTSTSAHIPVSDLIADRFKPLSVAPGILFLSESDAHTVVEATELLANLALGAKSADNIDKITQ